MALPSQVNEALDDFLRDSLQIVTVAQERRVPLRILGALSCYLQLKKVSQEAVELYQRLGRMGDGVMFTDLDVMGYRKHRSDIMKVLEKELHLTPDLRFLQIYGGQRLLYYKGNSFSIDVFLDKLEYSHDVDFRNRLELDYPTISLADFVLEKLQIHEVNRKDLVDLVATFLHFDVQDGKGIDSAYISTILAGDWGFWYDANANLRKTVQMGGQLVQEGRLNEGQRDIVEKKVSTLLSSIEGHPKSKDWTKRSSVGTAKPWYRAVEEVVR